MKKLLLAALFAGTMASIFAQTNVGIGTNIPGSNLQVSGSMAAAWNSQAANYTLTGADHFVLFPNSATAAATFTLPPALTTGGGNYNFKGREYVIKNGTSAYTLTIVPNSGETIDGAASVTVAPGNSIMLISTGLTSGVTWNVAISATTPGGTAGGDLSGSYPNPTVAGIAGKSISGTLTSGDVLEYNGANWVYVGTAPSSGSGNYIQNAPAAPPQSANFIIQTPAAGTATGVIEAKASQTADMLDFENSGGTVLAKVDASGNISTSANISTTGTGTLTVAGTTALNGATTLSSNTFNLTGSTFTPGGLLYTTNPSGAVGIVTSLSGLTLSGSTLSATASSVGGWGTSGNSGTAYPTNYLGTTTDEGLLFKVNSTVAGRIEDATSANSSYGNTALGYSALPTSSAVSNSNTAVGYQALYDNTGNSSNTLSFNSALGYNAMYNNTTGYRNTAIGGNAAYYQQTGYNNTAVGFLALSGQTTPVSGNTGNANTAIGMAAGSGNSSGASNTYIGYSAGVTSTQANGNATGSYNTFLGAFAGPGNTTQFSNATAIGANAAVTQSNSLILGSINGINGATSNTKVGIGTTAPATLLDVEGGTTSPAFKLVDGTQAPGNVLISDASGNASWAALTSSSAGGWGTSGNSGTTYPTNYLGTNTDMGLLLKVNSTIAGRIEDATSANSSFSNTALGYGSLPTSSAVSNSNTAIGYQALHGNTGYSTGNLSSNNALGYNAMYYNSTGYYNSGFGTQALYNNTTGAQNTAVGDNAALFQQTGSNNTAVGYVALGGQAGLISSNTGSGNTAIGVTAGSGNSSGGSNTYIGLNAGVTATAANANQTGSNNTYIGANAGPGVTTQLSNATAIGNGAIVSASNALVLGNGANVGIGTPTPVSNLTVNTAALSAEFTLTNSSANTPTYSVLTYTYQTMLSSGTYYNGTNWVVSPSTQTAADLFSLNPGNGGQWLAANSSNISGANFTGWAPTGGAWVTMWDDSAHWKGLVRSTQAGVNYFTGGNVGIGTNSPASLLHTVSNVGTTNTIDWDITANNEGGGGTSSTPAANTGWGVGLQLKLSNSTDDANKWAGIAGVAQTGYANNVALAFYTQGNTAGTGGSPNIAPAEAMRITGISTVSGTSIGGDVLIGYATENLGGSTTLAQSTPRLTVYDAGNVNPYSGTLNVYPNNGTQGVSIGYAGISALAGTLSLNASGTNALNLQNVSTGLVTVDGALSGTAASTTFTTNSGTLATAAGSTLKLASFGFASTNESSLGIIAYRSYAGSGWYSAVSPLSATAIGLGMDVDNSTDAPGTAIWLNANGCVSIASAPITGTAAYTAALAKLYVSGNGTGFGGLYSITDNGSCAPVGYNCNTSQTASIYATGNIVSGGNLYYTSDFRIKKDFKPSNTSTDLLTLNKLKVTDYHYIDAFEHGTAFKKGFVAQQVESVFPEAINYQSDFIPDVYALAEKTDVNAQKLTVSVRVNHGFCSGDIVRLITTTGGKDITKDVKVDVIDDYTFAVDNWDDTSTKVFVYGKQVNDFHTVDYDRIYTLNVSATQELARELDEAKCEIEELKKQNSELSDVRLKYDEMNSRNEKLQSDMDRMKASIETMQQILGSKAQK